MIKRQNCILLAASDQLFCCDRRSPAPESTCRAGRSHCLHGPSSGDFPHQAETENADQPIQRCGGQVRIAGAKVGQRAPVNTDFAGQFFHRPSRNRDRAAKVAQKTSLFGRGLDLPQMKKQYGISRPQSIQVYHVRPERAIRKLVGRKSKINPRSNRRQPALLGPPVTLRSRGSPPDSRGQRPLTRRYSASNRFRRIPIRSISTSVTSPGFK